MDVKVIDNSDKVIEAFWDQFTKGLSTVGNVAEGYAKEKCPVDTGRLRNSISNAVYDNDAYIGTNVEYAPYQEYGTSRGVSGKHFLRDAASDHSSEYRGIMESALRG